MSVNLNGEFKAICDGRPPEKVDLTPSIKLMETVIDVITAGLAGLTFVQPPQYPLNI